MNVQIVDNSPQNMFQRIYGSRTFDFLFGLVPAAVFGILGAFAAFFSVNRPELFASLISPPPENTTLLRILIGFSGFAGAYGCISLYSSAILRQEMSHYIKKFAVIGLLCGSVVALLWVALNVLTIFQSPLGLPDMWVNVFSIFSALSVMSVSVKHIKMLNDRRNP